jgi:murein L,D-transpeptidase YcbB/YkuD
MSFVRNLFYTTLVLSLAGCATPGKDTLNIGTQQLEMRIRELEKDARQKDSKMRELESKLESFERGPDSNYGADIYPEKKASLSQITPRKIQTALKKAGFYREEIDGRIGINTRNAIKDFQKKNSLKADGIVGEKTWILLNKYLDER